MAAVAGGRQHKSSLSKEQQERLASGPSLQEFVRGNAPSIPAHLIRKKGQRSALTTLSVCVCVLLLYTGSQAQTARVAQD